jgi:DNA-directed RNA polymerase
VRWTTPTGLPWSNLYQDPITKRVKLAFHDKQVTLTVADGSEKKINKDKAANGVAPNFVHSLDASHLALAVNAAMAAGVRAIATVHDSFGCLASRATTFSRIIRQTFVDMYEKHDVLAEVLDRASCDLTIHNSQRLPEGLEYGELNLQDVTEAEYAFS